MACVSPCGMQVSPSKYGNEHSHSFDISYIYSGPSGLGQLQTQSQTTFVDISVEESTNYNALVDSKPIMTYLCHRSFYGENITLSKHIQAWQPSWSIRNIHSTHYGRICLIDMSGLPIKKLASRSNYRILFALTLP